jgi:predicted phosphoribosyltransferase/dienelactone hydrolase
MTITFFTEKVNYVIMMVDSITCKIVIDGQILEGDLNIPTTAKAVILFAHGSGSSRHSTRNQYVAEVLNKAGFATLLVDLLSPEEKQADIASRHLRYNIELLSDRFKHVTKWLLQEPKIKNLKIGYFGSSTGAAAAIIAAASFSDDDIVKTLVLRGGRPDLAEEHVLEKITAPLLLIVGSSDDTAVIGMNKAALKALRNAKERQLAVIPGAGHLFEEPGKMEEVAHIAAEWYEIYLLCTGRKFENKYGKKKYAGLSSIFRDKPHVQIKFKDRAAAGELLASSLAKYKKKDDGENTNSDILLIGIARGGVIVADVIAKKLAIHDLDVVIPRKLRAPDNSENAIGAVMQDGSVYLVRESVESMNVSNQYLEMEKLEQLKEIDRRMRQYRPETTKEYKIKGRTVFLVDDGAGTGATVIAASTWIRKHNPKRLIIALPVVPSQIKVALRKQADGLENILSPSNFRSVEQFYQNFDALSDYEIIKLLEQYRRAAA